MMSEYAEDDFLALSGIQHFVFCKRQWALIHIEQQWAENLRTVEGNLMHERAHDEALDKTRNGVRTSHGLPVHSSILGIYGVCDIVEFHLEGAIPIEYKRGAPKQNDADVMQLVLQTICLEEMMCETIETGYLYYGETRHRLKVDITPELRDKAILLTRQMHEYFERAYTPKVKPTKSCNACSLRNLCLPKLYARGSAQNYMRESIEEVANEKAP